MITSIAPFAHAITKGLVEITVPGRLPWLSATGRARQIIILRSPKKVKAPGYGSVTARTKL